MHTSKCKSSFTKTKCGNTLLIYFLNPVGNIPKNRGQIIKQSLADENYDLPHTRGTNLRLSEISTMERFCEITKLSDLKPATTYLTE